MRIGLDIDDVLLPWSDAAHAAAEVAGITNGRAMTSWKAYEAYGCSADAYWDVVNDAYRDGMLLGDPYPEVIDLLTATRAAGHSVHLVTARGFDGPLVPLVRAHTVEWVDGIPHDSLTLSKDKTVVHCDAFLDDSVPNVQALREHGVNAYLRDQPHNRHDIELPRVTDLGEFLTWIGALP